MFTEMVQTIVDRIARTSDRIALLNDVDACTFGQLGARCQGIIDAIIGAADGVVMIFGHKEVDVVAAMLACALIRRPFVFVDIANPLPRIRQIAKTAHANVIICAQPLPGHVDGLTVETRSISSRPLTITRVEKNDRGLFYIVFTSGSTGTPKGVQIGCDNFAHFYGWYGALLQKCRGTDAHVNHASLSFDMGMLDLWPSLAVGKAVILLDHRHNPLPRANIRTLTRSPFVVPGSWFSTPTFLAMMCTDASFRESTLPRLRSFFVGGEPVSRSLLDRLMERFPGAEIWHAYGPTEVTCLTHCLCLTASDLVGPGPLPLGRALPPNEVRIVDEDGREMAAGESGEIELGGPQVAHGYLPKTHPQNSLFGTRDKKRFYRTGDYGIVDPQGSLTLSGRCDGQLKWNGNRVEIGEIERVAHEAIGVCQAVLVPLICNNRVVDLILFVQLRDDDHSQRSAFGNHLTASLPRYMRPRSIRFVDRLPLTLHGKVDRQRLISEMTTIPKVISSRIPTVDVDLGRMSAVGLLRIAEDATRRAGNTVLLRFPQKDELLILGDVEHVRFWQRHQNWFRKEVDVLPSSSAVGRLLLDESLTTAREGDAWLRLRRLSVPRVRPTIDSLRAAMAQATDWLITELANAISPVSLPDVCVRWSLKTVCDPLLGDALTEQEVLDFLKQFGAVYFDLISKADKDNIDDLRREPATVALRRSMDALVDAALSRPSTSNQNMMRDVHREIAKAMTASQARRVLRAVVIGTLAGSVDNVGTALLWTLIHLARAPEATSRIASEAEETHFDNWQITATPFAFAAVREAFRLTPVQPFIERTTTTEMNLVGHTIGSGVNVLFSPWLVQRSEENWPDPLTYDIARFRPGQAIEVARYFPFGVGKRICVGMDLALCQLTFAVSKMCRDIDFVLSECCKPGHLKPLFRLNLSPRGPIHMDLTPRRGTLAVS